MKHGLELINCGSIFLIDGHNVFLFFFYNMCRVLQYCCVESFVNSYSYFFIQNILFMSYDSEVKYD